MVSKSARSSDRGSSRPVVPTARDTNLAADAGRRLAPLVRRDLRARIGPKGDTTVLVPAVAVQALVAVLAELARGNAIAIVPIESDLTTQQAADVLGVSRPFLVKELDAGKIPVRMVGTHRRIRLGDLMRYRDAIDTRRHKVLGKLTQQAQKLAMGY